MKIRALGVRNYGSFTKQAVFEFKDGINVIYGLNRTTSKNSKNSNWVGKSLFFNSLSEVLFDQPIVGLKNDKVKTGTRTVLIEKDGRSIQIIRNSGKRDSIKIVVDGQEIEHLTKTKAQDWINDNLSITKAEFESLLHLDSRIPHPLVMGTSTDRKHFFDSFFRLDQVDNERRLYLKKLRQLKEQKTAFTELKTSYLSLKKQLIDKQEISDMKNRLIFLKGKCENLMAQSSEYQTYQSLKIVYSTLKPKIDLLPCELSEIEACIDRTKAQLQKIEDGKERAIAYSVYTDQLKEYEESKAELSEFARSISSEKAEEGANRYRRYKEQLADIHPVKPTKPKDVPVSDYKPSYFEAVIADLLRKIEYSKQFKSGVCPTCGQPVKTNNVEELQLQLKQAKANYQAAVAYENYMTLSVKYASDYEEYKYALDKQQTITAKVEKYEKYSKAWSELRAMPAKPTEVEKPKYDLDWYRKKEKSVRELLDALTTVNRQLDSINRYLNWKGVTEFDNQDFNATQAEIAKLEAKLEYYRQSRQQLTTITSRLRELKSELADYPIVEELANIFSDNVIKKAMVQQISTKLCDLLNYYSSLVFDSPYTFSLVWDSQIQLICERRVGRQTLVSDVRKLSGAESKLFTVILVLSLLSLMPASKRPQLMLMDEPTANMSQETTQAFMKLLTIMQKIVPCLVIITPRNDVYPESRPFTILRDKNGSSIVSGYPDDL